MTVTEIVMTSYRYVRLFLYSVTVIIMGGMCPKSVPKIVAIDRFRTVDGPRYQELLLTPNSGGDIVVPKSNEKTSFGAEIRQRWMQHEIKQ